MNDQQKTYKTFSKRGSGDGDELKHTQTHCKTTPKSTYANAPTTFANSKL
jgi:hypothetical protein